MVPPADSWQHGFCVPCATAGRSSPATHRCRPALTRKRALGVRSARLQTMAAHPAAPGREANRRTLIVPHCHDLARLSPDFYHCRQVHVLCRICSISLGRWPATCRSGGPTRRPPAGLPAPRLTSLGRAPGPRRRTMPAGAISWRTGSLSESSLPGRSRRRLRLGLRPARQGRVREVRAGQHAKPTEHASRLKAAPHHTRPGATSCGTPRINAAKPSHDLQQVRDALGQADLAPKAAPHMPALFDRGERRQPERGGRMPTWPVPTRGWPTPPRSCARPFTSTGPALRRSRVATSMQEAPLWRNLNSYGEPDSPSAWFQGSGPRPSGAPPGYHYRPYHARRVLNAPGNHEQQPNPEWASHPLMGRPAQSVPDFAVSPTLRQVVEAQAAHVFW